MSATNAVVRADRRTDVSTGMVQAQQFALRMLRDRTQVSRLWNRFPDEWSFGTSSAFPDILPADFPAFIQDSIRRRRVPEYLMSDSREVGDERERCRLLVRP